MLRREYDRCSPGRSQVPPARAAPTLKSARISSGNIYFATVKQNPVDARTLLGLFPVALSHGTDAADAHIGGKRNESYVQNGFIGLSVSCDGTHWSAFERLLQSTPESVAPHSRKPPARTNDHPVDGYVVRGSTVSVYVHRNVPGIYPGGPCRAHDLQ